MSDTFTRSEIALAATEQRYWEMEDALRQQIKLTECLTRQLAEKTAEAERLRLYERRFPIQGCYETTQRPVPEAHTGHIPGTVPWSIGVAAWERYAQDFGEAQSAERIAERGGFGHEEMDGFKLPGDWRASFVATKERS